MSRPKSAKRAKTPNVIIQNVNVLHPEKKEDDILQEGATVVIRGGRIDSVTSRGLAPRPPGGALVLDGTGKWLLPGYVDTHVHFFQSGNPYTRPDTIDLTKLVPYEKENARNHARLSATLRTWLACGVIGVMDMGGPFWNFEVRETAKRMPDAPRVQATGPLFSMVDRPQLELNDPPIIKVSNAAEIGTLAKRQLARKPDYLKVWYIHLPQDDLDEQEKIVAEVGRRAHAAKMRLAVHATELETAKSAMRAGANILVHSVFDRPVDEEFLRMAKARHVVYMPTVYVERGYHEVFSRNWRPTEAERRLGDPQILERMRDLESVSEDKIPEKNRAVFRMKGIDPPPEVLERRRITERNLYRVWSSGVMVTLSTDAGNIGTVHGPSIFREMTVMVHAGLTPAQVLRCATTNGAHAMRLEREIGRVASGFAADLVLLNSNPADNIENANDVSHVIRAGRVFSVEDLLSNRN